MVTPDIQNPDQPQTKNRNTDKNRQGAKAAPLIEAPKYPYDKEKLAVKVPEKYKYENYSKTKEAKEWSSVWSTDLHELKLQLEGMRKQLKPSMKQGMELTREMTKEYKKNTKNGTLQDLSGFLSAEAIEKSYRPYMVKRFPKYKAISLEYIRLYKLTMVISKASMYRENEIYIQAERSISGVVVDDQGKPLSDVEMTIVFKYSPRFFKSSVPKGKGKYSNSPTKYVTRILPNGKFNFRIKTMGASVGFRFRKEGYYPPEESLGMKGLGSYTSRKGRELRKEFEQQIATMVRQNKNPSECVIKRHNVIIRLDKKGGRTNLNKYYRRLVYKPNGSGKVIDFSKPKPQIQKVKDIKNTKVLPKSCVVFTAKPNKADQFQDIYWDAKFKGVPTDNNHPVIEYRLIINDPDPTAGFYLVDPKKEGKYHKNRRMREAPENGYVRELVFGSKQKYQVGSFYIKINGKYGKGKIDDNGYYHSSNKASCGVLVRMQPDGSRNLEIPRWFIVSPYLNYEPRGK